MNVRKTSDHKFDTYTISSIFFEYILSKVSPEIQTLVETSMDITQLKISSNQRILFISNFASKNLSYIEIAKLLLKQIPLKDRQDFLRFCFLHKNQTAKKFAIATSTIYASLALTDPDNSIREFAISIYSLPSTNPING